MPTQYLVTAALSKVMTGNMLDENVSSSDIHQSVAARVSVIAKMNRPADPTYFWRSWPAAAARSGSYSALTRSTRPSRPGR